MVWCMYTAGVKTVTKKTGAGAKKCQASCNRETENNAPTDPKYPTLAAPYKIYFFLQCEHWAFIT